MFVNKGVAVAGRIQALPGFTRLSDPSLKQTVGWCCTNGRFWPKTDV